MNELAGVSEAGLGEAAAAGTDPLTGSTSSLPGVAAAEHLPPAFPERAAWGTVAKLRAWQEEAIASYFASEPRDFLAAATPGAGKTTFALRLAAELRARRTVDQIIVVAPTEHLKKQWADAAARAGIRLDPGFSNAEKRYGRSFHGIAVTYAQLAARPALHREITESKRSLVILDEVHHGGDSLSWGDAVREAYSGAERRLSLTGTPFRSDTAPIPFVEYAPNEHGIRMSRTDYSYGYGRALRDGVVRPVLFMVYAGHMRWRTKAGDEMDARLGDDNTPDITAAAWRTALEPSGEWIQAVLASANRRLSEVREQVHDAGGLVIASDQALAREYAAILHGITGEAPTLVLSDEPASSERIETFAKGSSRWMVAVRMVSEGVDVPRLSVGVYATSAATPLYFAQAIGRFVRARRRGEMATVFVPNVPILLALAAHSNSNATMRSTGSRNPKMSASPTKTRWSPPQTVRSGRARRCSRAVMRRSPLPPPLIESCTTATNTAHWPSPAPQKSTTSSASPAYWSPNRSLNCCGIGKRDRPDASTIATAPRRIPMLVPRAMNQ